MYHQMEEHPFINTTNQQFIVVQTTSLSLNNFPFSKHKLSVFASFTEYFHYHETGGKNMKIQCLAAAAEHNQRDGIQQSYCMLPGI